MPKQTKPALRMSDEAVKAKTGKTWKEWFAILTSSGAKKMSHQEIVKLLTSKHHVGPWWQQMIAVTYEQQAGLRQPSEKPNGYEISVSRTMAVPLRSVYQAVAIEGRRDGWLEEEGLRIRKATPNKSIRLTWKDGKTSVEFYFAQKAAAKTQVVAQHSKLPDAKAAARMKSYWRGKLDRLQTALE
jgi:uncharacterized protein YndB with AHSA1/START domain